MKLFYLSKVREIFCMTSVKFCLNVDYILPAKTRMNGFHLILLHTFAKERNLIFTFFDHEGLHAVYHHQFRSLLHENDNFGLVYSFVPANSCIFSSLHSADNVLFMFHYASKTKCISKTNFKLLVLTSQQEEGLIIPIRLMGLEQTKTDLNLPILMLLKLWKSNYIY